MSDFLGFSRIFFGLSNIGLDSYRILWIFIDFSGFSRILSDFFLSSRNLAGFSCILLNYFGFFQILSNPLGNFVEFSHILSYSFGLCRIFPDSLIFHSVSSGNLARFSRISSDCFRFFSRILLDSYIFFRILSESTGIYSDSLLFTRIFRIPFVFFRILSNPDFFRLSRILSGSFLILSDFVEFSRFISEFSRTLLGLLRFFRILS